LDPAADPLTILLIPLDDISAAAFLQRSSACVPGYRTPDARWLVIAGARARFLYGNPDLSRERRPGKSGAVLSAMNASFLRIDVVGPNRPQIQTPERRDDRNGSIRTAGR